MSNQFTASLWGDEAFSAVLSMNPVSKILEIITKDTSPPLYNIILHFWYQLFGTSEIAIRSLSFVFFLVAVFFTYKIGALLFNRKTGFLAAVLTFLNPFFFIYAFEGRMYSILALGVAASMYFFLKKNWVGYVIATTWALYSHHFAVFAVFIQGLWFIYEFLLGERKVAIKMLKSFITIAILYLPWIIPLYNQTKMVGGGFWLGRPTLVDLRNLIYEYLAEGIKNPKILGQISLYFVFAAFLIRVWHKKFKKSLFLLSWFLVPILVTWLLSQKMQSIFFNRYLLYTIPGSMLLLASNGRKYTGIIIGFLLIFFGIIDFNYFIHPNKRPFKELANYVQSAKRGDDILINWNDKAHHLWESIYYRIPAPIYLPQGSLPYYVGTAQMTDEDMLKEIPKGVRRVGVVTSGSIENVSLKGYTKKETKEFGELKFIWMQKIK